MYSIDNKFFLEKVYEDLDELMEDEKYIKDNCKKNGFKILNHSWCIQDNPNYHKDKFFNLENSTKYISPISFLFKLTLKYK